MTQILLASHTIRCGRRISASLSPRGRMANLKHHMAYSLLWVNFSKDRLFSRHRTTRPVKLRLQPLVGRGLVDQKYALAALLARYVHAYSVLQSNPGKVLPLPSYTLTRARELSLLRHVLRKPQLTSPQQIRRIKCDETKPSCTS